jgi:hypothetical protein
MVMSFLNMDSSELLPPANRGQNFNEFPVLLVYFR